MTNSLANQINSAFRSFADALSTQEFGLFRENEAVSVFAFSHLVRACTTSAALSDPGQIAIEVAVPQIRTPGTKAQVRKDLVIWSGALTRCWNELGDPTCLPLAILEWKRPGWRVPVSDSEARTHSDHDLEWLGEFSKRHTETLCYSVNLPRTPSGNRLSVVPFAAGNQLTRQDYL